jgi:SAM-dependent methyltransferase
MASRNVDDSLRHSALLARAEVQRGALRGEALLERLLAVPFLDRDGWTDVVLGLEDPPADAPDLPRGAVPYLPSGVEEILATVRDVPLRSDDELVDLGSGLGRVLMLAHLLSGARGRGVEVQEHLVAGARARCAELALDGITFVHANAADAEHDGSVFFLYAPCNGEMLLRVVRRLEDVARRRPIVVCTVALELRDVPWLSPRTSSCVALSVYDSCVPGVARRA